MSNTTRIKQVYSSDLEHISSTSDLQIIAYKIYKDIKDILRNPNNYIGLEGFPLGKSLDHYFGMLEIGSGLPMVWVKDIVDHFDEDTTTHHMKPFVHFDQDQFFEIKERYQLLEEIGNEFDPDGNALEVLWNEENVFYE